MSGLAGWAAVQRGARRGGRAMCWREGSQSSCSGAAAEQKCRPAKSSAPGPRFKGNRRSGRPGTPRSAGTPAPRLSSPCCCCCPTALLAPGSPAQPRGRLSPPLLPGGGKGGNNALMCLLSTESISQVSACTSARGALPCSVPACILPFHPSLHLLSVTRHPVFPYAYVSLVLGFDANTWLCGP